ncbi:transposase [Paraburkholderia megapolitana]|uniref:transposase n=1 Tax=Paraburkholderia megapolitana TaxID=420953 RepID=UPI0038B9A25E
MKSTARGRQLGSRNYTKEFREAVVAESNDPNRSIADVARMHVLNANMVAQWRRRSPEARRATPAPCVELLPVDVVDLPVEDARNHAPRQDQEVPVSTARPSNCEIKVVVGKRHICIRGVSQAFAEELLRDCLK